MINLHSQLAVCDPEGMRALGLALDAHQEVFTIICMAEKLRHYLGIAMIVAMLTVAWMLQKP